MTITKLDRLKALYEKRTNDIYVIRYPHKSVGKGELRLGKIGVSIGLGAEIELTGNITIGDYSEIGENVKIFTHKHHWNHSRGIRIRVQKIEPVDLVIGKDVFVGTDAMLIGINSIGNGAIIGARSVVTKDVPPYEVWAGNPARKINERKK